MHETEGPFTSPCSNNTLWIIDFTIADQDMATITANFDAAPFQLTDVVYQGESTTYFQHGTATMTSVSIDGPRVTQILDLDTYCF